MVHETYEKLLCFVESHNLIRRLSVYFDLTATESLQGGWVGHEESDEFITTSY